MTPLLSVVLQMMSCTLSHHVNTVPTFVSNYLDDNLNFKLLTIQWRHEERQKEDDRQKALWDARMKAWWQKQAEFDAKDRELRRQMERAKNPRG